ncbi:hypothetical protein [Acidovorax sp. SDU_ACID1]|uniref:hypothetical protein n=1 Tax=Acidovorax sp. SDU_ACID1 TaxID=3136632 RepID=UPI003873AD42
MTETELQALGASIVKLSMLGGVLGAICWSLLMRALLRVADAIQAWEDKRIRIATARMRNVHGPLLLPGMSSSVRRAMANVLRKRHASTACQ